MARLTRKSARTWVVMTGALLTLMPFGLVTAPAAEAATSTVVAGPLTNDDAKATCPAKTHLIGGGYVVPITVYNENGVAQDWVTANAPSTDEKNTWAVSVRNGKGQHVQVQAIALCESNS